MLDLRCSGSDAPAVMHYRKSFIQTAPTRSHSPPARAGSFFGASWSSGHVWVNDRSAHPLETARAGTLGTPPVRSPNPRLPRGYSLRPRRQFTGLRESTPDATIQAIWVNARNPGIPCALTDFRQLRRTAEAPQFDPCQGRGRGFESLRPLQNLLEISSG